VLDRIRATRPNASGRVLVGLLGVVVVAGALAGVVAVAVHVVKGSGKVFACKVDKRNVETASAAYFEAYHFYARDLDSLLLSASPKGFLEKRPDGGEYYTIQYHAIDGTVSARGVCT
jgi:hypothetical protein